MPKKVKKHETRSWDELRAHYEVEKRLAEKLRRATREERQELYAAVYDELYKSVKDHPTAKRKPDREEAQRAIKTQLSFLRKFVNKNTSFLEIGPGSCALSFAVCDLVRKVTAVDVSQEVATQSSAPENLSLVIADAGKIDVPEGTIDVAYSHQVVEHLHPEDAREQSAQICRALSPGGKYVCITPNRLNGPHDISMYFDHVATGLHLKEYTTGDVCRLLREAGFDRVAPYVGLRGYYFRFPRMVVSALEWVFERLAPKLRRRVTNLAPVRALLGIRVVAVKCSGARQRQSMTSLEPVEAEMGS